MTRSCGRRSRSWLLLPSRAFRCGGTLDNPDEWARALSVSVRPGLIGWITRKTIPQMIETGDQPVSPALERGTRAVNRSLGFSTVTPRSRIAARCEPRATTLTSTSSTRARCAAISRRLPGRRRHKPSSLLNSCLDVPQGDCSPQIGRSYLTTGCDLAKDWSTDLMVTGGSKAPPLTAPSIMRGAATTS